MGPTVEGVLVVMVDGGGGRDGDGGGGTRERGQRSGMSG